jgi:hypothetical protein
MIFLEKVRLTNFDRETTDIMHLEFQKFCAKKGSTLDENMMYKPEEKWEDYDNQKYEDISNRSVIAN